MNLNESICEVANQWLDSGTKEPLVLERDQENDRVLASVGYGAGSCTAKVAAKILGVSWPTFKERCEGEVYRLRRNDAGEYSLKDVYAERNRHEKKAG